MACALTLAASIAAAQEVAQPEELVIDEILQQVIEQSQQSVTEPAFSGRAETASGGTVRVLDKITGVVTDLTLQNGEEQVIGLINLRLNECRYPADNPAGDAFGSMRILYADVELPAFEGWMIASAPALNAMDHPRYDVWMLRCSTS